MESDNTMKNFNYRLLAAVFFLSISFTACSLFAQTKPWVTAYYIGWETGTIPANSPAIVWSGVTVIAHFALWPNSDGSIDYAGNGLTTSASSAIISAAHSHNVKVVVTVGGANSESLFMSATSSSTLSTFVSNIVNIVKSRGYDGVDIDWEGINQPDVTNFTNFTKALRQALPSPQYLLFTTSSTGSPYTTLFNTLQSYFDQINIMTYDLAGNWQGWVSWYNGSVGIYGTASTDGAEASACCDVAVDEFIKAGVASNKIGIGSEWGGTIWTGVTGPNQSVSNGVSVSYDQDYTYIKSHYSTATYHWDADAQASYLSTSNTFISYDDTADINAKFGLIKKDNLGGLIVWTLGMGYTHGSSTYPLMQVLAENLGVVASVFITAAPATFSLSQNYPNPFNPSTTIYYDLAANSFVTLKVYDLLGREVATLVDGQQDAGAHKSVFDGTRLASGVYFYRLQVQQASGVNGGAFTQTKKLVLIK